MNLETNKKKEINIKFEGKVVNINGGGGGSTPDLTDIKTDIANLQETKQDKETVIVYDETELQDIVSLYTNQRIIVKNPIERDFTLAARGESCFDFMTGNSIPIITFMPANLQWIKPLELKPNKRYLILFDRAIQEEPYYNTNIIGMWTEVDIETSQTTEE